VNLRFVISEQACLPDRQGIVICDLFDISGLRIKRLLNDKKMPGTYDIKIDLSDIPAGIYFCELKTNGGKQTKKVIKL